MNDFPKVTQLDGGKAGTKSEPVLAALTDTGRGPYKEVSTSKQHFPPSRSPAPTSREEPGLMPVIHHVRNQSIFLGASLQLMLFQGQPNCFQRCGEQKVWESPGDRPRGRPGPGSLVGLFQRPRSQRCPSQGAGTGRLTWVGLGGAGASGLPALHMAAE